MSSTVETGHAKNVATFEDLIGFCNAYGAPYNPKKPVLKLPALIAQHKAANVTLLAVKDAKTAHDKATNAREIAFKPLRQLATKVVSALAASDVISQTVDDARSTNMKIQGRRVKALKKQVVVAGADAPAPVRTSSTSQQSFDKMVDHLTQLVSTVSAEPEYDPNERELSVPTLNAVIADLRAKNSAVIATTATVSNARIARDRALYADVSGLIDTAHGVKQYVKSLFGSNSLEYKQVSKLKFLNRSLE